MFKNVSIKIKVLAITLIGLFLLASAVGFISVNKASEALMKNNYGLFTEINHSYSSLMLHLLYFCK